MVTPGSDPDSVVSAFQAGDESALADLYARWSPLVYSIARRSLGDVTGAELICARVFSEAWTARQTFDPTQNRISGWLVDITRRKIDEARSSPIQQPYSSTSSPGTAVIENNTDLAERLTFVDALTHLDVEPQQVIQLALYDNLTHIQIAERLGLSIETVRRHLREGLLELRRSLEVRDDAR